MKKAMFILLALVACGQANHEFDELPNGELKRKETKLEQTDKKIVNSAVVTKINSCLDYFKSKDQLEYEANTRKYYEGERLKDEQKLVEKEKRRRARECKKV